MVNRSCNILKSNSFFIFGARGSGKSSLLSSEFPNIKKVLWIDFLIPEILDQYAIEPSRLLREIEAAQPEWVVIDEVQKLPKILDLVHHYIETKGPTKFALTGSSARRLKQAGTNLLAGRAFINHLYPFTSEELKEKFDLNTALNFGLLPKIYNLENDLERKEYLKSYALTYLTSEIQAEQWVRNLEPFRKFLPIAAQMNGQLLNYSAISRQVGVEVPTVQKYFEILQDTLLGFRIEAYHRSIRKRQLQAAKFYFIDPGIKRALERTLHIHLQPRTSEYGWSFEHFVILELYKRNSYARADFEFFHLRTKDDAEIDLVLERAGEPPILIEIKSTECIQESDFKSLLWFKKDFPKSKFFLLSQDTKEQTYNGISAFHWSQIFSCINL